MKLSLSLVNGRVKMLSMHNIFIKVLLTSYPNDSAPAKIKRTPVNEIKNLKLRHQDDLLFDLF